MRRVLIATSGTVLAALLGATPALANDSPVTGSDFYRLNSTTPG